MDTRIFDLPNAPLPLDPNSYYEVLVPDGSSATGYTSCKIKPINLGARPYKSYVFLLDQAGTDVPVPAELENSLTDPPVFSRSGVGRYLITSTDFVIGKVHISGMTDWNGNGSTVIPIWDESAIIGYIEIYCNQTTNLIGFESFDATFTRVDLSTLIGVTKFCFPDIKVYP